MSIPIQGHTPSRRQKSALRIHEKFSINSAVHSVGPARKLRFPRYLRFQAISARRQSGGGDLRMIKWKTYPVSSCAAGRLNRLG
jgi:hypothetical protein